MDLSSENILKLVSDYDIFRLFMPNTNWKINEVTRSPFHVDNSPSFLIGNKNGYLAFVDFSMNIGGDAFAFVQKIHNCSYNEALQIIDKSFGLGICDTSNVGKYKKIVSSYKQPEEDKEKHSVMIQVITRKFTNEELSWWNEYHQDLKDLRENNVYSIDKLFLNRKRFPLSDTELRFGYLYSNEETGQKYWKTYRPNSGKKSKWVPNNTPNTMMDGKENIINCDIAFIGKSKKDMMVIKKVFPCSCAVQNEGLGCFSLDNVEFLKFNSKRQILSFDSDVPGVTNSQQITELFKFDYCNVPRQYLAEGIKDWAALGAKYGLKTIENILKEKGII